METTTQTRPRRTASTATPTSTHGKKRTPETSAEQPVEEQGEEEESESGPEDPPPYKELRKRTLALFGGSDDSASMSAGILRLV